MKSSVSWAICCVFFTMTGCGGGKSTACDLSFVQGDDGHVNPLGAGPNEARAGRVTTAMLPASATELAVWAEGDFVLANDRVAIIIEDAGPSDLYDPWGGRPVGIARVEAGALVEPADFGEFFILTGRESLVTQSVTVLNDGSDGSAAIVRAVGMLAPTPFFDTIVGALFPEPFGDIPTAIDYVLEPGAETISIYVTYLSPREQDTTVRVGIHAYMFTPRMPTYAPVVGFATEGQTVPYVAFIDERATSYAYFGPNEDLDGLISQSGFSSNLTGPFDILACAETRRLHASLTVGGPGLNGVLNAIARDEGVVLKTIRGVVTDADQNPAAFVRVHAEAEDGAYLTRALSDATGAYTLDVPTGVAVNLIAWRQGDEVVGPQWVAATETQSDVQLFPTATIVIAAQDFDTGDPLPVRVQVLPVSGSAPSVPSHYGESSVTGGRLQVAYALDGAETLSVPAGSWNVVVSRGYEYEIHSEQVTLARGEIATVTAQLERTVDTVGVMCADYHMHTHRSADSPDDATAKVASAIADGLEVVVRSEHEFVQSFQPEVENLGMQQWAFGMGSVELTTMVTWGHVGVLPLEPDASKVNGGTPLWQRFPTAQDPSIAVETLSPPEVFAAVRARAETPVIIINHPRGPTNYFDYVGYDNVTGTVTKPDAWDETFGLVEVFNDSSWQENLGKTVADWLSFLNVGRRVFAVGSSDSHRISSSPIGYPRTCLALGTDDPTQLTPRFVRDVTAAGHSTISGGVYVNAWVGAQGPGDTVIGASATTSVWIQVQAASWVDVDWIDVVVDGVIVQTIEILPQDAIPNTAVRFEAPIDIQVAPGMLGTYVIVAAYGDQTLEPVHRGRIPFGVTNPIFLSQ